VGIMTNVTRRSSPDPPGPPPRSWLLDRPLTGFALPRGRLGSLLGRVMARLSRAEQREAFELLGVRPGERIMEAGYGPGVLVALLLDAGATVAGADPSPQMCALARCRNHAAVTEGRADLRVGTAERTGLSDAAFDAAVSVNNVPMWSDLAAGMRELRRVVRPGGRVLIIWHGGSRPEWAARRMTLGEEVLARILASMRATFGSAELHHGTRVVAFRATRGPDHASGTAGDHEGERRPGDHPAS
jgi:SAM-dependent methyltransferase